MLWVKAFHIIAVVTWFAGLFYLPRLFVYHADTHDAPGIERFKIMERRLLKITHIGGVLSVGLGFWLLLGWRMALLLGSAWMHAKLAMVLVLIGYHASCGLHVRRFAADANRRSARYFRFYNEAPALLLIAIVLLAVLKPF